MCAYDCVRYNYRTLQINSDNLPFYHPDNPLNPIITAQMLFIREDSKTFTYLLYFELLHKGQKLKHEARQA